MKFDNKTQAYTFMSDKRKTLVPLTDDELNGIKEFFTDEELNDLSFYKTNIEDCFRSCCKPSVSFDKHD